MVLLEASGKQTLSNRHYDSLSHDIKRQGEAMSALGGSSMGRRERIHCPGWTNQQFQQSHSVLAGSASAPNVMVLSIFLLLFFLLFGGTLCSPQNSLSWEIQLTTSMRLPNLFLLDVYKPQCYLLFALSNGSLLSLALNVWTSNLMVFG